MVEFLLNQGSYVDATDFDNFTPVDYAIRSNETKILGMLLERDAKPFVKIVQKMNRQWNPGTDVKITNMINHAKHIWVTSCFFPLSERKKFRSSKMNIIIESILQETDDGSDPVQIK